MKSKLEIFVLSRENCKSLVFNFQRGCFNANGVGPSVHNIEVHPLLMVLVKIEIRLSYLFKFKLRMMISEFSYSFHLSYSWHSFVLFIFFTIKKKAVLRQNERTWIEKRMVMRVNMYILFSSNILYRGDIQPIVWIRALA